MIKSKTTSTTKMEGDGRDKAAEKPLDYSLSCSMKVTVSPNLHNLANEDIVDNEKITLSGGDSPSPKVLEGKEVEGSIDTNNANSNKIDGESSTTKILKLRASQKQEAAGKSVFGNNNVIESNNSLKDKLLNNYYEDGQNWKSHYYDSNERHVRFPWKRMAYVCVLLVLGITCAILALMKICGGADWMNTATFAVIIMGGIMLLPPGLYYTRIIICICCRCKEYSLWDVPAGPFG